MNCKKMQICSFLFPTNEARQNTAFTNTFTNHSSTDYNTSLSQNTHERQKWVNRTIEMIQQTINR